MPRRTICPLALLGVLLLLAPSLVWSTEVRTFMKLGYLALAPDAEDLEYVDVDGGDLDEYLDVSKVNFGIGAQVFPDFARIENAPVRLGVDVGFQKLYSSKFQAYEDSDYEDREYEFSILGIAEITPAEWDPIFFQVGAGLHNIFYSYEYEHHGYTYLSEEASGQEISFGFMGAGGYKLKVGDGLTVPLMVRFDHIFRHGQMLTMSAFAGLSFTFK